MRPPTPQLSSRVSRSSRAAQADNIRVFCRLRPLAQEEESKAASSTLCVAFPSSEADKTSVSCTTATAPGSPVATASSGSAANDTHHFTFSQVFRPTASQSDVFEVAGRPSVRDVMAGYNSTIFAYGQTGSGKTHTMFGLTRNHTAARMSQNATLAKRKSSASVNSISVLGGGGDMSARQGPDFFSLRDAEGHELTDDGFSGGLSTRTHDDCAEVPPTTEGRRGSAQSTLTTSSATLASPRAAAACEVSGPSPTAVVDRGGGIVPRAVHEIFTHIASAPVTTEFEIRLFFVEVYMEQVRDLLSPDGSQAKRQVREDVAGGRFYVEDCEMPFVASPHDILQLVQAGLKRRATSATAMNEASSRSHCILNITVKSTDRRQHESRIGRLFLVDLAGSEKVAKTQSAGMRLEEAKLINRSLTSLSQVISSLSEGQRHVPYRDSVLTKILKDSLGGNARTSLVICGSPSVYNAAETLSTLRFGARARAIKNRAVVNRQYSVEELETMLRVARQEIAELQSRLLHQTRAEGTPGAASGSAATSGDGGVTAHVPDGRSPPHVVRRLDPARTTGSRTADGSEQGAEVGEEDLVMVSLVQRSKERMRLNDLIAEIGMLKDALKSAEEVSAALAEERDAVRQRVAYLAEECGAWQSAYTAQRHRLSQTRQEVQQRDAIVATQQREIHTLIRQMEDWLEPLRVATVAVEEATGEHRFDQSVPRARRRTLIALTSPVVNGGVARGGSRGQAEGCVDEEVVLFPPSGPSSLPSSHHASPTDARASAAGAQQEDDFPLSSSARANQSALERVAASLGARTAPGSEESPSLHRRSPPPRVSPRTSAPLPITGEGETDAAPTPGDGGALSEAAAARIVELERELAVTQREFDAVRQSYAAASLELQLSQKKLLIRQNRIESLKMSLEQECDTNRDLRQTIEKEHKGLRNLVQVARNDATYWRRRYEEVCASTGTPVASAPDKPSTPTAARSRSPVPIQGEPDQLSYAERLAPSAPREGSAKRLEGFNVFKSVFGGQRQP